MTRRFLISPQEVADIEIECGQCHRRQLSNLAAFGNEPRGTTGSLVTVGEQARQRCLWCGMDISHDSQHALAKFASALRTLGRDTAVRFWLVAEERVGNS